MPLSTAGLGGAGCRGDLASATRRGASDAGAGWWSAIRCGRRYNEPTRNNYRVGAQNGRGGSAGNRLAVPAHGWILRRVGGFGEGGEHHEKNRLGDGCLLFREQDPLDPGEHAGCEGQGRGRRTAIRQRGYLADLEADQRERT